MKTTPLPKCLLDGRPVASDDAAVQLGSRLAMYGEGCFDTFRCYGGGVLQPEQHLRRLHDGMSCLGWPIPESIEDTGSFLKTLGSFLDANGAMDHEVRVRVQIWSDDRTIGYRPHPQTASTSPASTSPTEIPSTRFHISGTRLLRGRDGDQASDDNPAVRDAHIVFPPVSLITSRIRRIPDAALPASVKWTNGINYILAAREAQQRGADDALMLTVDGYVSETTAANLFWVDAGTIFTPSDDCDLLPGITRSVLIDIIRDTGIPLRTGRFEPLVLHQADAVWMCNSVREICPVTRLDDCRYDAENPVLEQVTLHYENFKHRRLRYVQQA